MSFPNESVFSLERENERLRSELSDIKMALESLNHKQSENRLYAILQAMPIAVACTGSYGKIDFINKKFTEIFGYHILDIPTLKDWFKKAYPDDHYRRYILRKNGGITGNSGATGPEKVSVTCKDGCIRLARVTSVRVGDFGLALFDDISDNSERRRYEKQILEEKGLSEAILDSLPGVYYMVDRQGRFLRWNQNFEAVTGYAPDEVKIITAYDLFDEKDREYIHQRILKVFETGESDAEANMISKDGTRTPFYLTGRLAHIDGVDCLIGMGIDISRRKHAEKMQALGQLAGGVAHDFNNQLSAILGFAEILSSNLHDDILKSHARMIAKAATRSSDLTRQLLAFARMGKYQVEPVDIHNLLDEVEALLKHSIDKRIVIEKEVAAEPSSMVLGDANQLQNALLNLALNARDAMPDGGTLTLAISHENLDRIFCRDASFDIRPGRYVKICVADTGRGMDYDIQHRIYEPFFTTKDVGEGTGMGLAAVYGTVKNHNGAITLKSMPGQGSIFHVYLPRIDAVANDDILDAELGDQQKDDAVILVVDDEEMIRVVTSEILESLGYQVMLSRDGREAVEHYRRHKDAIDLVILDLMMPVVSGFETFSELKKINPHVKIILASGYSMDGQAQSLLQDGAFDFIQKPFTISQLTQKLSAAL